MESRRRMQSWRRVSVEIVTDSQRTLMGARIAKKVKKAMAA